MSCLADALLICWYMDPAMSFFVCLGADDGSARRSSCGDPPGCPMAGKGVQCYTYLCRPKPARKKSVYLENTLFFSCNIKFPSPDWTRPGPATAILGARAPSESSVAVSTCGFLRAITPRHRGHVHRQPPAEDRFLLQSLLFHLTS